MTCVSDCSPLEKGSVFTAVLTASVGVSMLLAAAIFGFFYAWVCSTMWGLDAIDPRAAITAMNGMNNSVRNAVFAPAFFGTPVALWVTAALALINGNRIAGLLFALAGIIFVAGAMVPTFAVNVPMNRALLAIEAPAELEEARAIWTAYSGKWQVYNILRTVLSGVAFLVGLAAVVRLMRK